MDAPKEHLSVRLRVDTIADLTRQAHRQKLTKSALVERYLEEGIRMAKHPGINFRDGPAGRRPGLIGRHLDVWEIVETVQHNHGDPDAAAEYLSLHPGLIQAALGYYADYQQEIDDWIEENCRLADELEAAWRKAQALGGEHRETRAG